MIRGCPQTGPAIGTGAGHTHCCSECASKARLGDVAPQEPDLSTGMLFSLLAIVGGFVLAAGASGKFKGTR